ncbi:CopD family protein [Streptomyces sp. B-S-A8]|uniref:CopD family protein n=1 Tax=Streptomyces solicavernae TaxID=3043614 RepID=A0ABT6RSQ8_9ACTN|nr:CopD family protein [Streptomyces sp. B-S-A8]MDI3387466.1 CopD family protein [Streptomyces sp. B-S-A8]
MSMPEPSVAARDEVPEVGTAVRRAAVRRALAVLVLVAAAALVPLLGPALALDGTGEATPPGAGVVTLLRITMFAALCVLVGESAAVWLARRVPDAPEGTARSWALVAAFVGAASAVGLALIVANGNLVPGSLDELHPGRLYETTDGLLALAEVNAFVAAGFCAQSRRPGTATVPLAAVIVAEALRAHPGLGREDDPLLGSALTLVHLTCAALWAGGLLQVLRTMRAWRARPTAGAALLGLYARVAAVLFAGITATGVCSTLRKLPLDSVFTTAYGRVLIAKLLLVAVIAALAVAARVRLRRSPDPYAAIAPARVEVLVLAVVVAVSALLTAVPAPVWWERPLWG